MVAIVEPVLLEFREEVPVVRRILERVPEDKLSWRPHPKSKALGELALHIANLPGMAAKIAMTDEFTPGGGPPTQVTSVEQIRTAFENSVRNGEEALNNMTEETALGSWRLVFNGK
jgi:hypothetical protein